MAAFRDVQCSQDVAKMAELRRFDGEHILYGCAYLEEGKVKYRVSSRDKEIYEYVEKSAANGIYPTPVMSLLQRCPTPSGREEDIKQKVKLQLAKDMKKRYDKSFFLALEPFTKVSASNDAFDLLLEIRDQLEGLFDEGKLQIFEGLVQMAFEAKVLSENSYEQMRAWLKKIRVQMEDDVVIKNAFERTLYGIGYEKNGELAYSFDAQKTTISAQKATLEQNKVLCSPIFAKTYWFAGFDEFKELKAHYLTELKEIMDPAYFELLKTIKAFPSVIDQKAFEEKLEEVKASCQPEAVVAFATYGYRWNALK